MIKLLLTIVFIINYLNASSKDIQKTIETKKSILDQNRHKKMKTILKIKLLAKQISLQNGELKNLEEKILKINKDLKEHQELLKKSKQNLLELTKKSKILVEEKKINEEKIVNTIIENFVSSMAIKLAQEHSEKELIDIQIYTLLSQYSKDQILKLNNSYEIVSLNKNKNEKKITNISKYIEENEKKKKKLNTLIKKHSISIKSLERKHQAYQKELKNVIKKQQSITLLLEKLNILKSRQIQREKESKKLLALRKKRKKDLKSDISRAEVEKRFTKDIDLDVRILGSSTKGIKISKYRGKKTISPLKSFFVVKKFGKYYDPVYKIKLFNESIILKTKKPKAKVYSIFNGKVVYAKKNAGMLDNVVIIQHRNGLSTIYSNLDEIAPTLRVGKWIKKGYVIGRVNDTLNFQATRNSYYIDPKDLFKI